MLARVAGGARYLRPVRRAAGLARCQEPAAGLGVVDRRRCYIPANLYPMIEARTLFDTQDSTIVGGAIELARHGSWVIALIILLASVAIPMAKFFSIADLALSVGRHARMAMQTRHRLYEVVEYIGR